MFIMLPTQRYRETSAAYRLRKSDGTIIHLGIVRFAELSQLDGVDLSDAGEIVMLEVFDYDIDRLKLANRMIDLLPDQRENILKIVRSWSHGNKNHGHIIRCVETGEQFPSIKACSIAHDLSYSQLLNHLQGIPGYKTVKGKTYKRN